MSLSFDKETFEKEFQNLDDSFLNLCDGPSSGSDGVFPIIDSLASLDSQFVSKTLIAQGGEKKIYRVTDQRGNRTIALASPVAAESMTDKESFLREARITALLQHPNILSVYEIDLDRDGIPYFTMEYVQGETLKSILDKLEAGDPEYSQTFTLTILMELFLKLCDAVAYAHSRQVLHLDIKPANIQIGHYGEVLLCDWGLAQVSTVAPSVPAGSIFRSEYIDPEELNDLTINSLIRGTPGYMAPEQVAQKEVSYQTDIYSLGALLYSLLTYKRHVAGNTIEALLRATEQGDIRLPSERPCRTYVPAALDSVAMKALNLDPDRRYRSVLELRTDVERYLAGFATEAEGAGFYTQSILFFRRNVRVMSVLFSGLVILIILTVVSFMRIQAERASALEARELAVAASEEAEAARKRAERNLVLYKQEAQERLALVDDIRGSVELQLRSNNFLEPESWIRVIGRQLEAGKLERDDRNVMLEYKALLHFVLMQFHEAEDCFSRMDYISDRTNRIRSLTQRWTAIRPADNRGYSADQISQLLRLIAGIHKPLLYHTYFYSRLGRAFSAGEKFLIAHPVLCDLNRLPRHQFKPELFRIIAHGKAKGLLLPPKTFTAFKLPIATTGQSANILKHLNVSYLDLRGNDSIDLNTFVGLPLSAMNISGQRILTQQVLNDVIHQLDVRRLYHNLEIPDAVLDEIISPCEFIRISDGEVVEPFPSDRAIIRNSDLHLGWMSFAEKHRFAVYLGDTTQLDEKHKVAQTSLSNHQIRPLKPGTYYWRIDTLDGDSLLASSRTWSFIVK